MKPRAELLCSFQILWRVLYACVVAVSRNFFSCYVLLCGVIVSGTVESTGVCSPKKSFVLLFA